MTIESKLASADPMMLALAIAMRVLEKIDSPRVSADLTRMKRKFDEETDGWCDLWGNHASYLLHGD